MADEIGRWLEDVGLSKYADVFAENEIDTTVLPDLSEADFEKIGIPMGPRKKLLRAISALGDDLEAASMQVGVLDHNIKRLCKQKAVVASLDDLEYRLAKIVACARKPHEYLEPTGQLRFLLCLFVFLFVVAAAPWPPCCFTRILPVR